MIARVALAVVLFAAATAGPLIADETDAAIAAWVQRAETYRALLEDADEQAAVDVALGTIYARQGNAEKALTCARRLVASDSELASSEFWQVGMLIAEHVGTTAANDVLRMIKDPAQRSKDGKYMFLGYGARGDLEGAREGIKLIEDDEARFQAWMNFVLGAPDRATAEAAMREIEPKTDNQRERLRRIPDMLDRRAANRAQKSPSPEELWRKAAKTNDASTWNSAAKACREQGEPQKAREALSKALAQIDEIDLDSIRVATLTLIANEYLELGDQREGARVMKAAATEMEKSLRRAEKDTGPLAEIPDFLNTFLFSPAFVSTLARAGELEMALEWATPHYQFVPVGAGCTSEPMQAELQRQLPGLDADCQRALACAGVAIGLLEKKKPSGKSP